MEEKSIISKYISEEILSENELNDLKEQIDIMRNETEDAICGILGELNSGKTGEEAPKLAGDIMKKLLLCCCFDNKISGISMDRKQAMERLGGKNFGSCIVRISSGSAFCAMTIVGKIKGKLGISNYLAYCGPIKNNTSGEYEWKYYLDGSERKFDNFRELLNSYNFNVINRSFHEKPDYEDDDDPIWEVVEATPQKSRANNRYVVEFNSSDIPVDVSKNHVSDLLSLIIR